MTKATFKTTAIVALAVATLTASAQVAAALPGAAGFSATAGDRSVTPIQIKYRSGKKRTAERRARLARHCDRFLLQHQRTGNPEWKRKYFVCRYY